MFSEFYILIGLVAFVIQVIVLICFFIACSNIGKIKKAVETMPVDKYSMYQKFLAFGHAEKARESLEDYTWETIKVYRQYYAEPMKSQKLAELRATMEPLLFGVNSKWPE